MVRPNSNILTDAKYVKVASKSKSLSDSFERNLAAASNPNNKIIHCSPIQPDYDASPSSFKMKKTPKKGFIPMMKKIREDLVEFGKALKKLDF